MSKTPFANICIFMIFIISGLKLDTSSVKQAMKYWHVNCIPPLLRIVFPHGFSVYLTHHPIYWFHSPQNPY